MPASSAASSAASAKKYMSLKQVMPPRSISAHARSVPSRTKSAETCALLRGPDMLFEPAHERQVVGEAAHQRHRRVRVRVDQPGDEDVVGELDLLVMREALARLAGGQHRLDLAVAHGDGVVLEHRAGRLDRDDPARLEDEAASYRGVPWISTITRRFGARHAISAARAFWSGQDLTGMVLPKPNVSTCEASTPFDTR